MTTPHPKYILQSYVGGSVSALKVETKTKEHPQYRTGGGPRKKVTEFSRKSRKRLQESLGKLDRSAFRRSSIKQYSITLTYPRLYPNYKTSKRNLEAFRTRIERKFGQFSAFWRLGRQTRGAPHFHLLLFLPYPLSEVRRFVCQVWYEIVGSEDPAHLQAGTQVKKLSKWGEVLGYTSRYLAKEEDFQGENIGRVWGVWHHKLLPTKAVKVHLSQKDFYRVRRWYRRIAGLKGFGATKPLTIFVPHADVERMVEWLGYSLE